MGNKTNTCLLVVVLTHILRHGSWRVDLLKTYWNGSVFHGRIQKRSIQRESISPSASVQMPNPQGAIAKNKGAQLLSKFTHYIDQLCFQWMTFMKNQTSIAFIFKNSKLLKNDGLYFWECSTGTFFFLHGVYQACIQHIFLIQVTYIVLNRHVFCANFCGIAWRINWSFIRWIHNKFTDRTMHIAQINEFSYFHLLFNDKIA